MNALTVFIIDDQEPVRHALAEMLAVFGYHVEARYSAENCLRVFDQRRSGCVTADVRMPAMDGTELVCEMAREQGSASRRVVISGHADVPTVVTAIKGRGRFGREVA